MAVHVSCHLGSPITALYSPSYGALYDQFYIPYQLYSTTHASIHTLPGCEPKKKYWKAS